MKKKLIQKVKKTKILKYLYYAIDIHKRMKNAKISAAWLAEIKASNTNCSKPCFMCDFYNECFDNVGGNE